MFASSALTRSGRYPIESKLNTVGTIHSSVLASSAQICPEIWASGDIRESVSVKIGRIFAQFSRSAVGIVLIVLVTVIAGRRSPIVSQTSYALEPDSNSVCVFGKISALPETDRTPDTALKSFKIRSCTVTDSPTVLSSWLAKWPPASALVPIRADVPASAPKPASTSRREG